MAVIESLVGSPKARAAMATRPELMAATEANMQAALHPHDPGGLPTALRLALAARIAGTNADADLVAHYRAQLPGAETDALADPAATTADPRLAAILRHADLVTRTPREATQDDITALRAAGVAEADVVRLSQLVAFVNYQVRLLAGLRLIGAAA